MKEKTLEIKNNDNVNEFLRKAIIEMTEGKLNPDSIVPLDACSCTGNLWDNTLN